MQPVKRNIKHTRGDTFQFDFQVKDSTAQLQSAYFSIRRKPNDDDYVLQKSIGHGITEVDTDVYRVRLDAEDTADLAVRDYAYDLELIIGADTITPLMGTFTLTQDVTRGVME